MALFRRSEDLSDLQTQASQQGAEARRSPETRLANEEELEELRDTVSEIHRMLAEVADRGTAQDKVFDTLHSELQDYKNDFIYEHLKPVLWPLLFLFDSLEQYGREVVHRARETKDSRVEAKEVLDHLKFFRGQLVEALRICEVTPMKQPQGQVDPKLHKSISVEVIDNPEEENTIRRVVRTGWYLNGKVLRHAEVVIGKTAENARTAQEAARRNQQQSSASSL